LSRPSAANVAAVKNCCNRFCGGVISPTRLVVETSTKRKTHDDTTNYLWWGILGTANIACKNWKAIRKAETSTLTAVASRERERTRCLIEECQAPVPLTPVPVPCGSYEELVERSDIDVLYIPLLTGFRKDRVLHAAEAGKQYCKRTSAADWQPGMRNYAPEEHAAQRVALVGCIYNYSDVGEFPPEELEQFFPGYVRARFDTETWTVVYASANRAQVHCDLLASTMDKTFYDELCASDPRYRNAPEATEAKVAA
jgi:hypothetical protein